jgi:spermidine/putrescine transport system permease protein
MLYTDTAVLIGMAYVYLPLMVLPIYAGAGAAGFPAGRGGLRPLRHALAVLRRG